MIMPTFNYYIHILDVALRNDLRQLLLCVKSVHHLLISVAFQAHFMNLAFEAIALNFHPLFLML